MNTIRLTSVLAVTLSLAAVPAPAQVARPTGIYAIGLHQQPPSVALVQLPFVDGVSLALGWSTVEANQNVYNFSAIGQTLAVLEPLGKKLVLAVFPFPVPTYVNSAPGVQTYLVPHAGPGFLTPVPWDNFGLTRWEALCQQLANHLVPNAAQGGSLVPLRDHPLLVGLACWPVGMNGVRDIAQQSGTGTPIHTLNGYSRATLASAIIRSTHAVVDRFPGRFRYLPFFRINDNVTSPTLDTYLLAALKTEFFSGAGLPQLGLFQENMSCTGPSQAAAFGMFQEKANTYTMLQAIQSWVTLQPLGSAGATDPCLVTTVPGNRSAAISGPEVGINRGFTLFNCRYFEIYKDDLLHAGFADEFQTWHQTLHDSRGSFQQFGQGCKGSAGIPTLAPLTGHLPWIGVPFTAQIGGVPQGALRIPFGLLGLSSTSWNGLALPFDLTVVGMSGCTLYTGAEHAVQLSAVGGVATWSFSIPLDPALVGVLFYQQAFIFDQGVNILGATTSNAAELRIGVQ